MRPRRGFEAARGRGETQRAQCGRRAFLALLALLALTAGCRASPDPTAEAERALTREEFVEIMVALREAERAVAQEDSASALFADRKAEILARHGATEADLRAFVETRSDDIERLQALWDTIAERSKYVPTGAEELEHDLELDIEHDLDFDIEGDLEGDFGTPPGRPGVGEQRLH